MNKEEALKLGLWQDVSHLKNPTLYYVGVVCPEYCDQRYIRDRDMLVLADNETDAIQEFFFKRRHWLRNDEKHLVKVIRKATDEDLIHITGRYVATPHTKEEWDYKPWEH